MGFNTNGNGTDTTMLVQPAAYGNVFGGGYGVPYAVPMYGGNGFGGNGFG